MNSTSGNVLPAINSTRIFWRIVRHLGGGDIVVGGQFRADIGERCAEFQLGGLILFEVKWHGLQSPGLFKHDRLAADLFPRAAVFPAFNHERRGRIRQTCAIR